MKKDKLDEKLEEIEKGFMDRGFGCQNYPAPEIREYYRSQFKSLLKKYKDDIVKEVEKSPTSIFSRNKDGARGAGNHIRKEPLLYRINTKSKEGWGI